MVALVGSVCALGGVGWALVCSVLCGRFTGENIYAGLASRAKTALIFSLVFPVVSGAFVGLLSGFLGLLFGSRVALWGCRGVLWCFWLVSRGSCGSLGGLGGPCRGPGP